MLTKELSALKQDLIEKIQEWSYKNCEGDGWNQIGYVGEYQAEMMAEAAFTGLMAIKDTNKYFTDNFDLD